MKTLKRLGLLTALPVALVAAIVGVSAVLAQEPATNTPPAVHSFRVPLVRDLELIDQVKALAARVADLEAKNADLTKKVTALETKTAALEAKLATTRK